LLRSRRRPDLDEGAEAGGRATAERAAHRRGRRARRARLLRRLLPEGRDDVRRRDQDFGSPGRARAARAVGARARGARPDRSRRRRRVRGGLVSKETAFSPRLTALTDQWMDLFGYFAPSVVTDVREEYRAVREAAGLMDFTMLRKVDVEGPDALAFMNTLVGRDVGGLAQSRIAYGPLVHEDGKMVDDCTVMNRGGDRVRFCGANDRDFEIFSAAAEGTGIQVREFTDAMPHLCVQGPRSREVLQTLTSSDL